MFFLLKYEVSQMWVQLQLKLKFNQNWPYCPTEEIQLTVFSSEVSLYL